MASPVTSISQGPSARLVEVWRADLAPARERTEDQRAAPAALDARIAPVTVEEASPAKLRVEIDTPSGRFVHTLLNSETQEVLLRYPSDGTLAFSRAISAYMRALNGRG